MRALEPYGFVQGSVRSDVKRLLADWQLSKTILEIEALGFDSVQVHFHVDDVQICLMIELSSRASMEALDDRGGICLFRCDVMAR